jgi:hypothetical protein
MKRCWLVRLVCALALLSMVAAWGCTDISPERARRHRYTVRTDLERMKGDIDWILGLDYPADSYDETLR